MVSWPTQLYHKNRKAQQYVVALVKDLRIQLNNSSAERKEKWMETYILVPDRNLPPTDPLGSWQTGISGWRWNFSSSSRASIAIDTETERTWMIKTKGKRKIKRRKTKSYRKRNEQNRVEWKTNEDKEKFSREREKEKKENVPWWKLLGLLIIIVFFCWWRCRLVGLKVVWHRSVSVLKKSLLIDWFSVHTTAITTITQRYLTECHHPSSATNDLPTHMKTNICW